MNYRGSRCCCQLTLGVFFLVQITIHVSDVNDNPPAFAVSILNTGVPENAPIGTVVDFVMATDPDFGANANFTYAKTSGDADGNFLALQSKRLVVLHTFCTDQEWKASCHT